MRFCGFLAWWPRAIPRSLPGAGATDGVRRAVFRFRAPLNPNTLQRMQRPVTHSFFVFFPERKPPSPLRLPTPAARRRPPPPLIPYLLPKALVLGCAGQGCAGRPAHPRSPIQLEQRPGPQCLGQGLQLAQPLPLQLSDSLGLPRALQLLDQCYWKKRRKWAQGPLCGWFSHCH